MINGEIKAAGVTISSSTASNQIPCNGNITLYANVNTFYASGYNFLGYNYFRWYRNGILQTGGGLTYSTNVPGSYSVTVSLHYSRQVYNGCCYTVSCGAFGQNQCCVGCTQTLFYDFVYSSNTLNITPTPLLTLYQDSDNDLYGNSDTIIMNCAMVAGYVLQGGDCDDTNPLIYPGISKSCYSGPAGTNNVGSCQSGTQTCQVNGTWTACSGQVTPISEICNGLDDDCDGMIDEGVTTPDIDIQGGSPLVSIIDGDITPDVIDNTEFGSLMIGSILIHTFTIQNTGTIPLNISGISSSSGLFVVGSVTPPGPVGVNNSATFTLTFSPASTGLHSSEITILNDDCDEAIYTFMVQGTGIPACISPTIDCSLSNISVNNDSGQCGAIVSFSVPTTGTIPLTVNYSDAPGSFFPIGTTIVTATASNLCGSSNCMFTVLVTDNEDPIISNCPANISVNNDAENCSAVVTWTAPTATDNCAIQTFTSSHNSGDTFVGGTTTVTYTATDIHGNSNTCSFDITVTDNENPVIANCPSNISVNSDLGNCSAVVTWTAPTASDNCAIQTFVSSHNSGDAFIVGTTTVTYTATDIHGNSSTCSFDITVTDNENPVIANCPSNSSVNNDLGNCSAIVTWTAPTATDNCAIQTFTSSHNSGDAFIVGTTTVTYTATDIHGNSSTCSFDVVVTDNENPVIANCPTNINVTSNNLNCDAIVTWTTPTATDNCAIQTFISSHNSGDTFVYGVTTVNYSATDIHGNSSSCSFTITVTGGATWFADTDGDGFGNVNDSIVSCVQPLGYVIDFTDCNDSDSLEFPGQTWYIDEDGDAYSSGVQIIQCARPLYGFVTTELIAVAGDCNDVNSAVNPGAIEICNGIDDDCDGFIDENLNITLFTVDGGGSYCSGGAGVIIGLSGSDLSVTYELLLNGISTGMIVQGTGLPISFGFQLLAGTYTIEASAGIFCESLMNGNALITIVNSPPTQTLAINPLQSSACVGNVLSVTTNNVAMAELYTWSAPAGTLINGLPSPVTTSVPNATITLGALPANSSGWQICVFASNPCGQTNTRCAWIRGALSTPLSITGSSVACQSTSGNYSIAPIGGVEGYLWSGTNGITFTGSGTSVVANFPAGFTNGSICVRALLNCGYQSNSRCLNIVNSTPTLGAIAGVFAVCPGQSGLVYSIPPTAGAATYTWTTPTGVVVASGQGTNSVTVNVNSGFNVGNICVVATSFCGVNSAIRCKTISSTIPATPGNISGIIGGICNQTITYSVPAVLGITDYNWILPSGATFGNVNGNNTVDVTFANNFNTGQLCVTANNTCGPSNLRCINVKGAPTTPGPILGANSVCAFEAGLVYSVSPVFGATSYNWTVPAGVVIIAGQGTNTLVVDWGSTGGVITVTVPGTCGNSGTRTMAVGITCRISGNAMPGSEINIYPNPVSTMVNIEIKSIENGIYSIEVLDLVGRILKTQSFKVVKGVSIEQLSVEKLAKGIYIVKITDGKNRSKEIRLAVE